ncbi:MAG: PEGA domain-containing protein [Kofleriaceae bacterium]
MIRAWIACVGLTFTSVAVAAPAPDKPGDRRARSGAEGAAEVKDSSYRRASQLAAEDDNDKALIAVDEGLAAAPKDLQLLGLKGTVLLKLRDYTGALAAYQAYLAAGAKGANRREAQKIVNALGAVKATFVDITLANGPATIYLDSKTQGAFCAAAAPCKKPLLPGDYKVIAERAGYERWTARVTIAKGKTAAVAITLVEKPSIVTVQTQAGARIAIDDAPYTGPSPVPGGKHRVVVALAGHATLRREIEAHEGKPVAVDAVLVPLVPIQLEPRDADVLVDDQPVTLEAGGIAIAAGTHVVIARAPGHHDARIDVPAERPADYRLSVALAPHGAMLELAHAPRGTRVVVDGKVVGTSPLAHPIEVAPGTRTIELRMTGYRPYRTHGTFTGEQIIQLELGKLRSASRKRTYLTGAATGAALIAGTAFSFAALGRRNAYDARAALAGVTADDAVLQQMREGGARYSVLADVGFGLGIAGLAATTYFFLREGRGESQGSLRFGVGPTGAMAAGRF